MPVTDHFTRGKGRKHADVMVCNLCVLPHYTEYAWKDRNGTGSLHKHMKDKHSTEYAALTSSRAHADNEPDDISSAAAAASPSPAHLKRTSTLASLSSGSSAKKSMQHDPRQPSLFAAFAPMKNAELSAATARFFATNHIAYNVASSDSFCTFISVVRQSTVPVPQRMGVKAAIGELEQQMRSKLWTLLKKSAAPIAIAIDGWTNVKHTKVLNVVLICGNRAYYWRSIPNPREKSSAQWMQSVLEPVIAELVQGGVRVAGFVADNEAVNGAAFRLLEPAFPFLIRVPCAAHTLQLVVKQLMAASRWTELREDVQQIFQAFFASQGGKHRRQQLQAFQVAKGDAAVLELVKPNTTRWNSEMYACERLVQLGDFIQLITAQRAGMWEQLKEYVAFLKPFQVATDVVQSDAATLFDVYQQWGMLRAHVEKQPDSAKAQKALKTRWETQIHGDAAIATAIVSLRKRKEELGVTAEQLAGARQFIISFGVKYISAFDLSKSPPAELKGRLLLQLGAFLDRRGSFSELDEQLESIQAADESWCAANVWALHDGELAIVAKALLSLPASEAAVERTFSAQGLVHTKLRNRLLDVTVQQEMFVAFNDAVMSNKLPQRPLVVSAEFMADADFDTDIEEEEAESVSADAESEDEREDAPAPAAAAAPFRSRSLIVASTEAFLDEFLLSNPDCLTWRWSPLNDLKLENAAREYSDLHGIATPGMLNLKAALKRRKH